MAEVIKVQPEPTDDQTQVLPKKTYFKELISLATVVLLVFLGLALWASHHTTPSVTVSAQTVPEAQVSITAHGFSPQTLKIKPGTVVTWTNSDTANHQVEADPYPTATSIPGFDNDEVLKANDTMSFTFDSTGTYTYNDRLNPYSSDFHGTVQVSN